MVFRMEKIQINSKNMQDSFTGSDWEVEQEIKFNVHKYSVHEQNKK